MSNLEKAKEALAQSRRAYVSSDRTFHAITSEQLQDIETALDYLWEEILFLRSIDRPAVVPA